MCYVLYEQISLEQNDLVREAAKLLGFTRMGSNVVQAFESAIRFAEIFHLIEKDHRGLWLLTEVGTNKAIDISKSVVMVSADEMNSTPQTTQAVKKLIEWDDFYENYCDWADSTVGTKISRLSGIGPESEVMDVLYDLEEKNVVKLLKKAKSFGFQLDLQQFSDLDKFSFECIAAAIECINEESWINIEAIKNIVYCADDEKSADLIINAAIMHQVVFSNSDLNDIFDYLSVGMQRQLVKYVLDSGFEISRLPSIIEEISYDIVEEIVRQAMKKGYIFTDTEKEYLEDYIDWPA